MKKISEKCFSKFERPAIRFPFSHFLKNENVSFFVTPILIPLWEVGLWEPWFITTAPWLIAVCHCHFSPVNRYSPYTDLQFIDNDHFIAVGLHNFSKLKLGTNNTGTQPKVELIKNNNRKGSIKCVCFDKENILVGYKKVIRCFDLETLTKEKFRIPGLEDVADVKMIRTDDVFIILVADQNQGFSMYDISGHSEYEKFKACFKHRLIFCCALEIINNTLTAAAGPRKIIVIDIKTRSVITECRVDGGTITKLKFDNSSSIFFRTTESFQVTTLKALNINPTKTRSTNKVTVLYDSGSLIVPVRRPVPWVRGVLFCARAASSAKFYPKTTYFKGI